jgi:hypothetical protein
MGARKGQHIMQAAPLTTSEYGVHSLRAGMVTAANAEDAPDPTIMRRSDHSVQTAR